MLRIPRLNNVTNIAAIITPAPIKRNAFGNGMPKTKAARLAVQTPVKGKGMATKMTKEKFLNTSKDLP